MLLASLTTFITNNKHAMGVTLFYRGRLNTPKDIPAITNELEDICISAEWKYRIYDESNNELRKLPFRGISFLPHPKSENVWMLFLNDGTLFFPLSGETEEATDTLAWSSTKTQFAGADTHIALCRLFKYLSDRWFAQFEVIDDGGFWGEENSKALRKNIGIVNDAITALEEGLSGLSTEEMESVEQRVKDILEALRKKKKE